MTQSGPDWQQPSAQPANTGEAQFPSGYFQPTTPAGGTPVGQPGGAPAPRMVKRTPVVVLAVLVGVLVLTTGLFTTLFLVARGNHNEASERLAAVEKSIEDTNGQIQSAKSSLDDVERAHDDLESQNSTLHRCADSAKAAILAAQGADQAAVQTQVGRMYDNCG